MRQNRNKPNTLRLIALLLAMLLVLCQSPTARAAEASGSCGDNLSWELSNGTLIITGSGAMYDFPENTMAPWYDYRKQIEQVSLPNRLTHIGDLAFYDCTNLLSATFPDSVTSVGAYAFAGCTGMTMLHLGNGLTAIEEAAFRECASLTSIQLPNSLKRMGFQAFYRCESLTAVTIPASVTEMGMTTFAYCYNLIRADVRADIDVLPDWTFYGCSRLTDVTLPDSLTGCDEYAFYDCESLGNVEYNGENSHQIMADIERDLEGNTNSGYVGSNPNTSSSFNTVFEETDEATKSHTTTVTQTDNANIGSNVTVTYPNASGETSSSADVTITIENEDGWNEVVEELNKIVDGNDTTHVDVYVKEDSSIPKDVEASLADKNVTVSVHTPSGSSWQVDYSQIAVENVGGNVDLSYERTPASEVQTEKVGGADAYQIKFDNSVEINAEVMIKLPSEHAMQNAYLYQVDGNDLQRLQAAVVDNLGYAHFYLASVDKRTAYLVGINVPGETADDAIIPQNMYAEFDITDTMVPIDYVITGRTSSWGMDIGQVTWIMVGVLGGSVVVAGVVLYLLNKRKLRRGYVPKLDDEY